VKQQIYQARFVAVLLVTGVGLYLCWLMLKPFAGVLGWATVLVIVFHPVHRRLISKVRHPGFSALLSCLLVILIIVLPLTLLTIAAAQELARVVPNLPSKISEAISTQPPLVGKITAWLQTRFGVDTFRSQEFLIEQLKRSSEFLLHFSWSLVSNILGGVVKAFFVVFTMYYLFRDGEQIVKKLPTVLPVTAHQGEEIIKRIQEVVGASVYGVVTIATVQGMLGGLAFWLLGVPSPILWAVLMTFICMIPIAGSFLVWLPLSIYLMTTGHWVKAALLIVWGGLVVSTIDNFLRPKLIKNQTKLHELFVFFSVLGGISVFGLLGLVLGPVVLAITLGLLQTFRAQTPQPVLAN